MRRTCFYRNCTIEFEATRSNELYCCIMHSQAERTYRYRDTEAGRLNSLETVKRYQASEKGREVDVRQRLRNKDKNAARTAVQNAMTAGILTKPNVCSKCNDLVESHLLHAHHEDYSKPLDVRWLCITCHQVCHTNNVIR